MSRIYIGDIECDGLEEDVTRMHCAVFTPLKSDGFKVFKGHDKDSLRTFLRSLDALIGHNFFGYDLPVLKKVFGIEYTYNSIEGSPCKIIDTLALSRSCYPDRPGGHGLAAWGERFGIPKPKVEDWKDQPLEVYVHRCKEDVKINKRLYFELIEETKRYVTVL